MPSLDEDGSVWSNLRREAGPLVVHGITVLLLEVIVLLIGLGALILKHFLPQHAAELAVVGLADVWLALVLVLLFGLYTLIVVGMRLFRGVVAEWRRK